MEAFIQLVFVCASVESDISKSSGPIFYSIWKAGVRKAIGEHSKAAIHFSHSLVTGHFTLNSMCKDHPDITALVDLA